jgi:tetratricopeptide (TPR) repeat protein
MLKSVKSGDRPQFLQFLRATALIVLAISAPLPAQVVEVPELGRLEFPNSGAAEAQQAFTRGALLLHSFEYEDAREAFQEARSIDPDFALAAWGEAMTHNHPLWRQQDREAALEALAGYAPTREARLAKAPSERERGYLEAVEILYGEGGKEERDAAYEAAMAGLAERYPDDLEARAFYALSILGTTQGVRDFRAFMRAGAVAEEVFDANPRHPGAAHYLIHSYDDPVHAPLGLRAARVYASIAPAASHAQHMISHIFVALGRWESSVDSNVRAFEVSRERMERKGLGSSALNFHALQWLQYSYLQLGRWEEARRLLEDMKGYLQGNDAGGHDHGGGGGSNRDRWYHSTMRAAWVVETGGRDVPAESTEGVSLHGRALSAFATGYAAARRGDVSTLRAASEGLSADVGAEAAEDDVVERVMEKSLRALLLLAEERHDEALALLAQAAEAEGALPLEYGPPAIVKPSHELYGEVLIELGRAQEARQTFEQALSRAPRRTLSLAGLAAAARAQGDAETVARACGELASIRADADQGLALPAACG